MSTPKDEIYKELKQARVPDELLDDTVLIVQERMDLDGYTQEEAINWVIGFCRRTRLIEP